MQENADQKNFRVWTLSMQSLINIIWDKSIDKSEPRVIIQPCNFHVGLIMLETKGRSKESWMNDIIKIGEVVAPDLSNTDFKIFNAWHTFAKRQNN